MPNIGISCKHTWHFQPERFLETVINIIVGFYWWSETIILYY